jgi:hypothetical protein
MDADASVGLLRGTWPYQDADLETEAVQEPLKAGHAEPGELPADKVRHIGLGDSE